MRRCASSSTLPIAWCPRAQEGFDLAICHSHAPPETPVAWALCAARALPVASRLSANNSEALREAALGGQGIALLPDFSAQEALRSGKLVAVLPGWRPGGSFAEHLQAIRPYSPRRLSDLGSGPRRGEFWCQPRRRRGVGLAPTTSRHAGWHKKLPRPCGLKLKTG